MSKDPKVIETISLTDKLTAIIVYAPKYGLERYVVVYFNGKDEIIAEREFMSEHGARTGLWAYYANHLKVSK